MRVKKILRIAAAIIALATILFLSGIYNSHIDYTAYISETTHYSDKFLKIPAGQKIPELTPDTYFLGLEPGPRQANFMIITDKNKNAVTHQVKLSVWRESLIAPLSYYGDWSPPDSNFTIHCVRVTSEELTYLISKK